MTTKVDVYSFRVVDIGYGYLKYPCVDRVMKEKAVVALLGESLNHGELKGVDVIEVDGVKYIIGTNVYKLGRKPITANENVNRMKNVAYKVLALYALAKTSNQGSNKITLLTGLPFQNLDEADNVKKLFQAKHDVVLNNRHIQLDIDEVIVTSQGLGSFYTLIRQRGRTVLAKKILLVDLGFRTINYLPINNGDIDIETVKTNRDLGIQDAFKKIANDINLEFKTNYKFYDVDDLLDKGVPTQDINKGKGVNKIIDRDYVKRALATYATDVWTDFVDKYGDKYREELEEVIFSGGTSERVREYLESTRKHFCSFIEEAQDAQVLGYAEIASKIERERENSA